MMMTVDQEAHTGVFLRRALEFVCAGATLLLGLAILLLPEAWNHPVYALLDSIAPQRFWGSIFLLLGSSRMVVLIINGYWPFSPPVRFCFATATVTLVWFPLTLAFLSYFRLFMIDGSGGLMPGFILVGMAWTVEALCMYALAALWNARRHVG